MQLAHLLWPSSTSCLRSCKTTMASTFFSGKVAIILDAICGIGRETANLLSCQGCSLAVVGRSDEELQNVVQGLLQNGLTDDKVLLIAADVAKEEEVPRIVKDTLEKFNHIDFLVSNATVYGENTLYDFTAQDLERDLTINIRSPLQFIQLLAPHLAKTKGGIVNVSSVNGTRPIPEHFTLGMSNAVLHHLTALAALELGPKGVRVNAVAPGAIDSDARAQANFSEEQYQKFLARNAKITPLGRTGKPLEVANVIVFLLSEEAANITGEVICVDGGFHVYDRKQ